MKENVFYKTEIKLVIISKAKLDPDLSLSELANMIESEQNPGAISKKRVYLVTEDRAKELLMELDLNSDFFDETE